METAVTLHTSGIVVVLIFLGVSFLDFLAVYKIITKAGYSGGWIVVPLAPIVLSVVSVFLAASAARSDSGQIFNLSGSFRTAGIVSALTGLSVLVTWIFFLVFAFSNWPVLTGRSPSGPSAFPGRAPQPPAGYAPGGYASPRPAPTVPAVAQTASTSSIAVAARPAGPGAAPSPGESAVIYCSWCGKQRAVDAQAIHHCGSRERPAAYCMQCGTPLQEGSAACVSCGTPSTMLSR